MIALAGYRRQDVALIAERLTAERSRSITLSRGETELASFLPLSDAAYLVLLALARDSEGGFFEALEESDGALALGPGDLAAALDRLVQLGLLTESQGAEGKRYRGTALGEAVLAAESGRRRRRFDLPTMPKLRLLTESRRARR